MGIRGTLQFLNILILAPLLTSCIRVTELKEHFLHPLPHLLLVFSSL